MQITAEQILREARELQEQDFKAPKQKITDETELAEYRLRKRKEFEDLVRRVRWNSSVWVKVGAMPRLQIVSLCRILSWKQRDGLSNFLRGIMGIISICIEPYCTSRRCMLKI